MKKVCLITCYKQPDYIRAKTLRAALSKLEDVELIVVKNKHTGLWRYIEVICKLIAVRLTKHPDIYFLTFRGYEMLPITRLLMLGKPLIFDEFINLVEWVVDEHHKIKEKSLLAKILHSNYRFWLKKVNLITTDSQSHAEYSANLMKLPIDKYVPLIVSTDEQTFNRAKVAAKHRKGPFRVFYYGNMLPLHGIEFVMQAMRNLKDKDIELQLVGGKAKVQQLVEQAKRDGVNVNYKTWVPYDELPSYMQSADVCLGGPFGGTAQSQFVITGKTYQLLQMGCPVIIGRNLESGIFTDKSDTLVVEQNSAEALADAILWAKNHSAELSKIGQNGHKLYQEKLSNRRLIEQLRLLLANKHLL
ncbi:MAG: glycosyltransferase [Candidatus Saccharibacteria bacterium]